MAEIAIRNAEIGDFLEVDVLQEVLRNPFDKNEKAEERGFADKPPLWAKSLKLSCSS